MAGLKSERSFLETKMDWIPNAANERLYQSLEENWDKTKELLTKFDSLERELSVTLRKMNDRILEIRQETGSIVNTMPLLTMLEAAVLRFRSARVEFHKPVNQKNYQPPLHWLGKSAIAANVARLKTELIFADAKDY